MYNYDLKKGSKKKIINKSKKVKKYICGREGIVIEEIIVVLKSWYMGYLWEYFLLSEWLIEECVVELMC